MESAACGALALQDMLLQVVLTSFFSQHSLMQACVECSKLEKAEAWMEQMKKDVRLLGCSIWFTL